MGRAMSVIRMLSFCHDRTVSNLSKPCPNLDLNANTASETPSRLSRTPSWIQAHMLVPVQPIERSHLLVRELEIEDVSVGDDSPFGIRFGKRDESTAGQKIPMSMAFARTQIENPLTLSASSIESIPEPSSSPCLALSLPASGPWTLSPGRGASTLQARCCGIGNRRRSQVASGYNTSAGNRENERQTDLAPGV